MTVQSYYAIIKPFSELTFSTTVFIGQKSPGWVFSLNVYPQDGINSLDDWKRLWEKDEVEISRYGGESISAEEMLGFVTGGAMATCILPEKKQEFLSSRGAVFDAELNLFRGSSQNGRLLSRGEGSWDVYEGEKLSWR